MKAAKSAALTEEERAEIIELGLSRAVEPTREPDDIEMALAAPPASEQSD
jgi:hypothetical protein